MVNLPIYMDNNATTKPDPRVVEAMMPFLTEMYGNAASNSHSFGWTAAEAVDRGRAQIAALIGADPKEIVLTSGATEADNLALKGVMEQYADRGDHLITAATEHKAILDAAKHLERLGKRVTVLPVASDGLIDLNQLADAITDKTVLVSVMYGNNEIGTLQPIAEIGAVCRDRGVLFHTDGTQGVGKLPVDVKSLPVDLISFSAHKIHGPKGVGALYVRRRNPRVRLASQMDGGGHEGGFRSGTLNVPGIVGFGVAAEICRTELAEDAAHSQALRDRLRDGIFAACPSALLNGHPTQRLPGNLNVSFPGLDSDLLMTHLNGVAVSSGSACNSASPEPSFVLRALGRTDAEAYSALRFGLSRFNTEAEVDYVVSKIGQAVAQFQA